MGIDDDYAKALAGDVEGKKRLEPLRRQMRAIGKRFGDLVRADPEIFNFCKKHRLKIHSDEFDKDFYLVYIMRPHQSASWFREWRLAATVSPVYQFSVCGDEILCHVDPETWHRNMPVESRRAYQPQIGIDETAMRQAVEVIREKLGPTVGFLDQTRQGYLK